MTKYIVSQSLRSVRQVSKLAEDGQRTVSHFELVVDIPVGEYTEEEFTKRVGDEFLTSDKFKQFVNAGWIKTYTINETTEKTVKKYTKQSV